MALNSNHAKGITAIYVHAGAGFHNHQSEEIHLWVCNQAALLAMAVLKSGGNAVDAVEVAIKFLEDHEITNAGYGSNLTLNGTVECDATIVDHLGRSGAVGAAENIKNPIAAARLILDASTRPLAFHRVPPNLITGPGATDFARSQGIPVLPTNSLVSRSARQRWIQWNHELQLLECQRQKKEWDLEHRSSRKSTPGPGGSSPSSSRRSVRSSNSPCNFDRLQYTPSPDGSVKDVQMEAVLETDTASAQPMLNMAENRVIDFDSGIENNTEYVDHHMPCLSAPRHVSTLPDSPSLIPGVTDTATENETSNTLRTLNGDILMEIDDHISDTVGAIAIDCHGNIAAGSSSGGIGMKHCGRTGPAALVGVGTAVVPVDPKDVEVTSTAAVTSGTGEHMATCMAAAAFAERIYSSTRKLPGQLGALESVSEDEALRSVIEHEFMG
ncbi:hypothetical protein LOZ61_000897 [Ophidiomyces ophidiicola]|nr:hypothetical protein LOZ61_000897 [Ophidiomyces ophidiicola]KAI1918370.1 hypothetical protein LOZ64_002774 [Ophidiomyces ophidiicola]KAI1925826.1 hypothetical protein LOZ60_003882 [Ophidiomyces ophidiicola]KAI1964244.1 hypothetical protein LOZ59_001545 [Ophidiomyces ophidiicola]KAI2037392.1 hypothetical protein LOZ48_000472 [Ophidiomyces ophidiicola]